MYKNHLAKNKSPVQEACPTDVMMCPDGSSVSRGGAMCEFGVCPQEIPVYMEQPQATATTQEIKKTSSQPSSATQPVSVFQTIKKVITAVITKPKEEQSLVEPGKPSPQAQNKEAQYLPTTPKEKEVGLNETRYTIVNGKLTDTNNQTIYTLPPTTPPSSSWTTHTVNAVAVSNVPPVIGAIPIDGNPGKYYLSENSFGNLEACEFSNRIYILDTVAKTKTLMYEENTTKLQEEDPRACHSEMYLLATENEKLILKYHTIGTNMTCDSTWSEPEKTWYIDVTKLELGTRRYYIAPSFYTKAEELEQECRQKFEGEAGTSTENSTTPQG